MMLAGWKVGSSKATVARFQISRGWLLQKTLYTHSALGEVITMLKTVPENVNAFYKGSENSSQS